MKIAIHESEASDKVVKFLSYDNFTSEFIEMYENNTIDGVFFNEEGEIVAMDIWGGIHTGIIAE